MKQLILALLIGGGISLTSCDSISSRQAFIERNVVGLWHSPDEKTNVLGNQIDFKNVKIEFFPDRTYAISGDMSVGGFGAVGSGIYEEGTWVVSEDGRFKMSMNKVLGMGVSRTGQVWILNPSCREKTQILIGRFDDDMNFLLRRAK